MRLVQKHNHVGYLMPGERPGCRNCMHCDFRKGVAYRCEEHGLEVTAGGICPDFAQLGYRSSSDTRTLPLEFPQVGEHA